MGVVFFHGPMNQGVPTTSTRKLHEYDIISNWWLIVVNTG